MSTTIRIRRALHAVRRTWAEMEYAQRRMLELRAEDPERR